jgi:hypothetical protein
MLALMREGALLGALIASLTLGCDAESRACRSQVESAQAVVKNVKGDSPESLRASLTALDAAIQSCERAELGHEKSELTKARNQIGAQLEVLERRAARKKKPKQTPEEIALLVEKGDPSCPKGQAYLHGSAKKEIKCTGAQIIELGWEDVKEYFGDRKYKLATSDAPPTIKAEFGAELYVFEFEKPNDAQGARCVSIHPAPGVSWIELVSRLTGVSPDKIEAGKPVKSARGALPLSVEDKNEKVVARVGTCG